MIAFGKPALQMHREKTAFLDIDCAQMKSNGTCFGCLRRMPEITLFCGHAICEVCVENIAAQTLLPYYIFSPFGLLLVVDLKG